ncbi:cell division protein ZipA C-terminal FtsZ-binding domain-containing protein [Alkanindiges sp. WGS2144]|uniref:cell division protein ZipA C-terminal FtsZ-binding domain-containing protein n=1 Tax=Alkanindiges sp. WGS2144 TaxID=3366808 RepID=UPI003751E8FE
MDFLTIIGYLIAALAIATGLYLMLRKNVDNDDNIKNTEDAAAATDLTVEDAGRIPVVPRHARTQLESGENVTAPGQSPTHDTSTAPTAPEDDILEQTASIRPAAAREQVVDDTITGANSERILEQQATHLAESSKPDHELGNDPLDQALAQLEAATAPSEEQDDTFISGGEESTAAQPENTLEREQSTDNNKAEGDPVLKAAAVETAAVEEWQGESALLDAHLEDQERRDDESALAQAEHIVALYVMPGSPRALYGEKTIHLLRQFGLRYGEMALFHRFQDSDGTGPLMFSVLRYTSEGPSGFDLETLPNEQVEGLAFFLALPSKHAVAGYDTMVSISTLLAREIHGQVYDEHMNQLSPQLREHYRHFVLDYRSPA